MVQCLPAYQIDLVVHLLLDKFENIVVRLTKVSEVLVQNLEVIFCS